MDYIALSTRIGKGPCTNDVSREGGTKFGPREGRLHALYSKYADMGREVLNSKNLAEYR